MDTFSRKYFSKKNVEYFLRKIPFHEGVLLFTTLITALKSTSNEGGATMTSHDTIDNRPVWCHDTIVIQSWHNHDTVVIQSWHNHDTVVIQSWHNHDTVMVNHDTVIAVWTEAETCMEIIQWTCALSQTLYTSQALCTRHRPCVNTGPG